jgi:hypothetical protein
MLRRMERARENKGLRIMQRSEGRAMKDGQNKRA